MSFDNVPEQLLANAGGWHAGSVVDRVAKQIID
jgi:hypothetical protein